MTHTEMVQKINQQASLKGWGVDAMARLAGYNWQAMFDQMYGLRRFPEALCATLAQIFDDPAWIEKGAAP